VENVEGKIVGVRPNTGMGIIHEIAGADMKTVPIPGTGGITGCRNSDALVGRDGKPCAGPELTNDPAIGNAIKHHDWIATVAAFAYAAEAGPDRVDRDWSEDRHAG